MKKICGTLLLAALLFQGVGAEEKPIQRVERYFEALLKKRVDLALKQFGAEYKFGPSQQAVLKEYNVVDPTHVGRCEENLEVVGKALNSYHELYSGYPKQLESLVPHSLKKLPRCPSAPAKPYRYLRRDQYYYELHCPTGHGRTPGFPLYSPIDGVIPNPNLKLINFYTILGQTEEDGLTKVLVVGSTPKGDFQREFVFTPSGGFVAGSFSKEVEALLKNMITSNVPRATKLDPASLLLGVASFHDQELIRAAHCRLLQEQLYYKIVGMRTRLGEMTAAEVMKHLDEIPACPTSNRNLRVNTTEAGKTRIFCSGTAHEGAGLGADEPFREF